VMNEFKRTNRMEPLTQEQHVKKKAVIRENNLKAEEAVRRKNVETPSDQTERSNTHAVAIRSKRCISRGHGKDRG
jgi:hypothetical protein